MRASRRYEAHTVSDDVWGVVDQLRANAPVLSAEPDFVWEKTDYGAASAEEVAHAAHFDANCLDVESVWNSLTQNNVVSPGYGTVVAVIDTGVDYNHFDLKQNMWKNSGEIPGNGRDDDGNGYKDDVYGIDLIENDGDPMDDMGHGTHVAGIIAMSPGNGGGVGLAYGAKIMAIKAGQSNGLFAASDIAKAVKYAADNGADVINMSFGGAGKSNLVEAALRDAFSTSVLVAAAGNDGQPTWDSGMLGAYDCYPAAYTYVLGVMATENNGNLADFSNWDYNIGANGEYELAAPGVGIYSTLPGNRFAYWSGTSMAAPNVAAAAAIIRSQYTDKSKYSSRYIMGQLVSATKSTANKYDGKGRLIRVYPALNIKDSLKYQPKPSVKLNEFYLFDDPLISDKNNGDGIAQPGETIDIGLSAFNYWGTAADVTVTADANSIAGIPNPYVEFITNTAALPEIGTFATANNGFTYTDGALTGVSSPIRLKIKEGAPNDAMVQLNFTLTAKNGLDDKDKDIYTFTGSHTITIQNGYTLSGSILEDMTLTADKYWIIQKSVLIPEGVTVTVEPGTQIQVWSEGSDPFDDGDNIYIIVQGRLLFEGVESSPINIFPGKGYESRNVVIRGSISDYSAVDDNYERTYISMTYVNCINLNDSQITTADHCSFIKDPCEQNMLKRDTLEFRTLNNSRITNYANNTRSLYTHFLNIRSDMNCCLLDDSGFTPQITNSFKNNVIIINPVNPSNLKKNSFTTSYGEKIINNAFLSKYYVATDSQLRLLWGTKGQEMYTYEYKNNYWGTDSLQNMRKIFYDSYWNPMLSTFVWEPYLTLESPELESIYPFMTEAYLTDADGNRIDTVVGRQTVTMHVKFNRDMASDVQPMVTYGGSEPYTDFSISGNWASAREWTGTFTIDPYIDYGRMYIRTKGAVAADDRWLVTGEDSARFFFEITNTSAQSMSLQGSGTSGACDLSWMQDDYETFAGYNIYRATAYDSTKTIAEQSFAKINSSVLNAEAFSDTNVEQGKDYWYYFTVVDTGFKESNPSNVVKCTPFDEEGPVITHTPITTAVTGEPITVMADVTDNVRIDSVKLYYRESGTTDWKTVDMRNVNGNRYNGVIAAYDVTGETIEYYITAYDGTNQSSHQSEAEPLEITVMTEHHYDEGVVTRQPSCTAAGIRTYTCQDCGATYTEEIPMTDHVWDGGRVIKSNSCTEDGVMHYQCLYCSAGKDEVIQATGHDYKETVHAATCTEQGYTEHVCQNCNASYRTDFTPLAEHEYEETVISPATCTTDGVLEKVCKHCGDTKHEAIAAHGHHFKVEVVDPADNELGYTLHTCEDCGCFYQDTFIEVEAPEVIRTPGDANDDGVLDLMDVVLIRRFLAGGWDVTINESNADVDGDDEVTLQDVVLIRRYLAGGWDDELQ